MYCETAHFLDAESNDTSHLPETTASGFASDSGHCFTSARQWAASLNLTFDASEHKTRLRHMKFKGPLRVQRPFYPETAGENAWADPCHCYLLHPPGGMVSGDTLHITVNMHAKAHALLTTPSAGKVYAADSHNVAQRQDVRATLDNAVLEWLPQENIIFNKAKAELTTHIAMDAQSILIGWDIVCLGRPAAGEDFSQGSLLQSLRIDRDGMPLVHERLMLHPGSSLHTSACGLAKQPVFMTMFAVAPKKVSTDFSQDLDACRQDLSERIALWQRHQAIHCRAGITLRGDVLLTRFLGSETMLARELAVLVWESIRPLFIGRPAHPPRIWNV